MVWAQAIAACSTTRRKSSERSEFMPVLLSVGRTGPAFAGREWGDGMRVTNTHKRIGGLRGEQRQFRLRRLIAEKFCRVRRAAVKVEVALGMGRYTGTCCR